MTIRPCRGRLPHATDARGLAAGARSPAPHGPLFLAARDPARRAPGSLHAGNDRTVAGARVGRAGRARGRRQGHRGHWPGGHRLPRRTLRLDTRLAAPEAARRRRRLRGTTARERNPAAAAQVAAIGARRGNPLARCGLPAPCAQALRPQADELEHAFLRPGRGSVSGNAMGAVRAGSPGGRGVPASTAGRVDLE